MLRTAFVNVRTWVFDLDNTLYPRSVRLFDQIEAHMTAYVMRTIGLDRTAADALRRDYWRRYGTTLAGLMAEHGHDPEPYLADVHAIDLSAVEEAVALRAAIAALPGRKIVYTNGSRGHADNVLAARGLTGLFDARYGVEDAGFTPKPERGAFEAVFTLDGLEPRGAVMVEDDLRNLAAPRAMGMRTLWVREGAEETPDADAATDDLADFLARVKEIAR